MGIKHTCSVSFDIEFIITLNEIKRLTHVAVFKWKKDESVHTMRHLFEERQNRLRND